MRNKTLPTFVEIDNVKCKIRNNCDFRVVLDVLDALGDLDLNDNYKIACALFIFYENAESISDKNKAVEEMFNIINMGVENEQPTHTQPVMDWDYDFNFIVAAVNKILGYDVRREEFTHWWTFYSAYLEIGDCLFAQIVSIRSKKQKGKKLEKHEEEFYRANYKKINLPLKLTAEEKKLLGCD